MNKATFSVSLNSQQVLQYYQGKKNRVQVNTREGFSMSIPYDILLKFVTREGVHGTFEISYGSDGKLGELRKLG
ncbi:DUF2835 family protein [Endozoicomonas sp. 4G]|uniref:DUF2835 family protein n=1 Tax=Endozoicomonas sp. 4G TaxID=2872754 RepID=UPI002078BDB8|nr:DUF2835 family protein [Endozoicomonas sp. 4G]